MHIRLVRIDETFAIVLWRRFIFVVLLQVVDLLIVFVKLVKISTYRDIVCHDGLFRLLGLIRHFWAQSRRGV